MGCPVKPFIELDVQRALVQVRVRRLRLRQEYTADDSSITAG
jgi:hypothetical protein